MRRISVLIVVFIALGLAPAARAGQVQLLAQAPCAVVPHSISSDARYAGVTTCTGTLFLVDRTGAPSVLVSHAQGSATTPANSQSNFPVLSADGAFLAFRSKASNLVSGQADAVGTDNVFLYQRATGATTRITQRQSPGTGTGPSFDFFGEPPSLSADGRYTVFVSDAPDIVPGQVDIPADTGLEFDVFLYDRVAGTLTLVSRAAGTAATAANGRSERAVITPDGAYVVFTSYATNLVAGQVDSNGREDVFLYNRAAGTTTLVSRAAGSTAVAAAGASFTGAASADGRYVAFASNAANLVAGQVDPSPTLDVFLFDRVTGTTALVSHPAGSPATAGNHDSGRPSISANGRWIAYDSTSDGLVAGITESPASLDIFLYDRLSDTAVLVSHAAGAPLMSAASSYFSKISADGSFVAFIGGYSGYLVDQTSNSGYPDLFLFDRLSSAIVLVTRAYTSATREGDGGFYAQPDQWFIDADGSHVVFPSQATDLVPTDSNGTAETVFAFDNGLRGRFYTVPPCRLIDTRQPTGGGPLPSGTARKWRLHEACGIPVTAKAVAANVTVEEADGAGNLKFWPGDSAPTTTSTINFNVGQTRANNAILPLASNADGTVKGLATLAGGGTVEVVLDVSGYFE